MAQSQEWGSTGCGKGGREQTSGLQRILEAQQTLLVGQAEQEGSVTSQAAGCYHSDGRGREK